MLTRTNHGLKLSGIYPGRVVQHLDNGKCKVFIPGVYPDETETNPDMLPPAEQAAPLFGGSVNGNGCFSYPNIGAVVWCMFQNGDQNLPVYVAARLGGDRAVRPTEKDAKATDGFAEIQDRNDPNDDPKDDTSRNGDDFPNHMVNCGDSRIVLKESGDIEITCIPREQRGLEDAAPDKKYAKVKVSSTGDVFIESSSALHLTAPVLELNGGQKISLQTDKLEVNAYTSTRISTGQMYSRNRESTIITSPAIQLDGHEGSVVAIGKKHGYKPIVL